MCVKLINIMFLNYFAIACRGAFRRIISSFKDIDPFHVYVNEVELEDKTITRSDV